MTGSADYRVYAIAPRPGFEPSADAVSAAEELGIVYVAAPLNTEFKYYPLLNKAYACEYVARHYGGDAYLFLDSDTLFLNKMDYNRPVGCPSTWLGLQRARQRTLAGGHRVLGRL